jgi:hypothetical protein
VELPVGLSVSGTISDTHGGPVAGAAVGLCSTSDNCFDGGEAVTAGDGTFAIQPASEGTYLMKVFPPDGANLLSVWHAASAVGSQDAGDAVAIEVAGNVSGVETQVPDGLRISGTVRNPEGDPVAGVSVQAQGSTSGSSVPSAADGSYHVVGLTPGSYTLRVYAPDGSDFPSGIVVEGAVVADDGNADGTPYELVDADLADQPIALFRGRSISGHIANASGKPVEVSAVDASSRPLFAVAGDGTFTVRGLYPGAYHLQFTVPESLGGQFPYGNYNGQGKLLVDQSLDGVAIDVTPGDVTGVEAVLKSLPILSGTLRDVAGPVQGAMLNACDPDRGCARAIAAADGTWRVRNVPPGSYTIQAGAIHHVVVGYAAGRSNPDPFAAVPVSVGTTSVTGLAIVLPLGSSISGTVTGPGGVPLAGIDVTAGSTTGGIWEFGPGGVVTDAAGNFTASGLVNGSYKLSISPPDGSPYVGGYWSSGGLTSDWALATPIAVSDGTLPVVGAPGTSIRQGGQLGTSSVPVQVRWAASDPGSNLKTMRLQQQTNGGSWVTVSSPVTPSVNRALTASSTTTYRFRSRAIDYSGNPSSDKAGATFRVLRTQQTSGAVTWGGAWTTRSGSSASGGSYRRASAAGARATFTFTGRSVGWVAARGSSYGIVKIYVDGAFVGLVDLHASATSWRRIVFAKSWSSSGTHTIKLVNQGTAGRPYVNVDAFVTLR